MEAFMRRYFLFVLTVGAALGPASAQDMSLGQFEYRNSCAVCHGEGGLGDGPMAGMLEVGPPDLTVLQSGNAGVFPVQRVYDAIDGTADVRAHGMRDMPVWGARYLARVERDDPTISYSREQREVYARTRILALIEYLSTLQAK
jgi:mono/diheme cytochrome c family protein